MKIIHTLCLGLMFFCGLNIMACHKDRSCFMNDAVITGYDFRACACCGGLMLNMGDHLNKYDSGFYIIDKLPDGFVLDSGNVFPVFVRIDWQAGSKSYCGAVNHINITRIERR